jgi:hypothetical protein
MKYLIEPCASSKAFEIKFGRQLDLAALSSKMDGDVISSTPVVLLVKINGKPVSVYASGRAMIKEVNKKEAEEIARKLFSFVGG